MCHYLLAHSHSVPEVQSFQVLIIPTSHDRVSCLLDSPTVWVQPSLSLLGGMKSNPVCLGHFRSRECEHLHENFPCEDIYSVEIGEWPLVFNGSSNHREHGTGVVYMLLMALISPYIQALVPFFQQQNWIWSFFIDLISTLRMGMRRLQVQGDSKLIISKSLKNLSWRRISCLIGLLCGD